MKLRLALVPANATFVVQVHRPTRPNPDVSCAPREPSLTMMPSVNRVLLEPSLDQVPQFASNAKCVELFLTPLPPVATCALPVLSVLLLVSRNARTALRNSIQDQVLASA